MASSSLTLSRNIDTFDYLPPCPSRVLPPLRLQILHEIGTSALREPPAELSTDEEVIEWFIKLISTACDAFSVAFILTNFVQESADGSRYLVTAALPSYHDAWVENGGELPVETLNDITASLWTLIKLYTVDSRNGSDAARMLHAMMGDYTEKFYRLIVGNVRVKRRDSWSMSPLSQVRPPHLRATSNWESPVYDILRGRYLDSGKCLYTCTRAAESFGVQTAFYMSQLQSPEQGQDHSGCNLYECIGHQIDPGNHTIAHNRLGCQCEVVDADIDAVIEILQIPGLIPVIVFETGSKLSMRIVPHTEVDAYITISYAASQIFASPLSNSIPTCQLITLRYIARFCARRVVQKGQVCGVWIDTLLVPVQQIRTKYREQALIKMQLTFEQATVVLVVDPIMASRAATDFVAEEFMGYLLCSPWFTRLWTFMESQLAADLWVWYAGAPYALDDFIKEQGWPPPERSWRKTDPLETLGRLRERSRKLVDYERNLVPARSDHRYFDIVLENLRHRMTSAPTDEPFCLSTLLYLDTKMILDAPPQQRMEVFWSQVRNLSAILLIQSGHRLTTPGLQWAPRTLIGRKEVTRYAHEEDHTIRKDVVGIQVPETYHMFKATIIEDNAGKGNSGPFPAAKKLFFQIKNQDYFGTSAYTDATADGGWCLIRVTMTTDPMFPLGGEQEPFRPPGNSFMLLMRGYVSKGLIGPCAMLKIEDDVELDPDDDDFWDIRARPDLSRIFTSYGRLGGFSEITPEATLEVRSKYELDAAFEGNDPWNEERLVCDVQWIDMWKTEVWVS